MTNPLPTDGELEKLKIGDKVKIRNYRGMGKPEQVYIVRQVSGGIATILEVFFSNEVIETSPVADDMRANWRKFIDTDRVVMASRGYASNQLNKMQLFDDIGVKDQRRTSKFAIAYCRVLWQCAEFLQNRGIPLSDYRARFKRLSTGNQGRVGRQVYTGMHRAVCWVTSRGYSGVEDSPKAETGH